LKNSKPINIVLGGSLIISCAVVLALLITRIFVPIPGWVIILISATAGLTSFAIFYIFIRIFITEKLKIIYRSIRKGKFGDDVNKTSFSLRDDVIEKAEEETKTWTEERINEISKLKEQEAFRREFLGNLGHELKTPVFSIQGYILTLLEGGLEDESVNRKFLERASKATERMTLILEDLDQISKMEADQIKLDLSSFDIKKLIEEVYEAIEFKAKKKKIKLEFSKYFDPVFVLGDRSKITQVLMNLIGNSITYGKQNGRTAVRFYIFNDIITIEVSDNGPGIEEADLPRLFERFYRVEKSRNRNEGGTGLGLAICKHIIELHGQTINVRSTPNVGSTFTFSLDKAKK